LVIKTAFKKRREPMKLKIKYIYILSVVIAAFWVLGGLTSADRGMGYGHHGWMHGVNPGWGGGSFGDLNEDDIKKMDEERRNFFEATKALRQQVYQKRLALASELAKQIPDAVKAAALLKEISDVKAQLAQKHLDHFLRIRKINPDFGMGFSGSGWMGPGMMGPGMMHPGMMGMHGYGHWGRYDCPYNDRGGYGMRPGMMGPGGWGRDYSRKYHMDQDSRAN
jgi:hypothetical protein